MFKRKALAIYTFLSRLFFYNDEVLNEVEAVVDLNRLNKKFQKYYQLGFANPYRKVICQLITK
jgi:hypothetical protein